MGRSETGLTIFRPYDGLDEGAGVLQKAVEIGPDNALGSSISTGSSRWAWRR